MSIEVTNAEFDTKVLQNEKPVIVDFWAPWCGPCRILGPSIDELANDYAGSIEVVKVNVDENQAIAAKYGILSIPTVILFNGGEPVERMVGARPKEDIIATMRLNEYATGAG